MQCRLVTMGRGLLLLLTSTSVSRKGAGVVLNGKSQRANKSEGERSSEGDPTQLPEGTVARKLQSHIEKGLPSNGPRSGVVSHMHPRDIKSF